MSYFVPCLDPKRLFVKRGPRDAHGGQRLVASVGDPGACVDWPVPVPCGRCLGCREDRGREFQARGDLELKRWEGVGPPGSAYRAVSLTLTYDQDSVVKLRTGPPGRLVHSLSVRDVQLFFKRLRRRLEYAWDGRRRRLARFLVAAERSGRPARVAALELALAREVQARGARPVVKYVGCLEYGPSTFRPHAHFVVFGFVPDDLRPYSRATRRPVSGVAWESAVVDDLWGHGYVMVRPVHGGSFAYLVKYMAKADVLPGGDEFRARPRLLASRNLGWDEFERYRDQFVRNDEISYSENRTQRVPRYFLRKLEVEVPEVVAELRAIRRAKFLAEPRNHPSVREHFAEVRRSVFLKRKVRPGEVDRDGV